MGLGLQMGSGLRAAFDALRGRRAEDAAALERERVQDERIAQRALDLRRIAEAERSNRAGEGLGQQRIDLSGKEFDHRVGQQSFENEGTMADRAFTKSERERAARERAELDAVIGGIDDPASRNSAFATRRGLGITRGIFLNPIQKGTEAGQEARAAFLSGGKDNAVDTAKIEGDQQVRVAHARQDASSATSPDESKELDAVAEMVIADPELLTKMTPTDRGKILRHIGASGEGTRLSGQKKERGAAMQREALEALLTLRGMPGQEGAVGAPSLSQPGSWVRMFRDEATAGSEPRGYQEQMKRLTSALTLPRLQMMQGTGPLSNADIEMLTKSATSLGSASDEKAFNAELDRLEELLSKGQKIVTRAQLDMLAKSKGTTVEEQARRAKAEGYIVR